MVLTEWPRRRSSATHQPPRKPEPPVTRTVFCSSAMGTTLFPRVGYGRYSSPFSRSSASASGVLPSPSRPSFPITAAVLVNWISSYWTTWTRLPQGSRKSRPRPGRISTSLQLQCIADCRGVVDDETEMPRVVAGLAARRREGDELIAGVEKGHLLADAPTQLEIEQLAVEGKRLVDVADLEGDVVDADEPGLLAHEKAVSHRGAARGIVLKRTYAQPASIGGGRVPLGGDFWTGGGLGDRAGAADEPRDRRHLGRGPDRLWSRHGLPQRPRLDPARRCAEEQRRRQVPPARRRQPDGRGQGPAGGDPQPLPWSRQRDPR